ncbi:hypothetical protein FT663_03035 [Candidozyma haemuli var. vulneris]|uniref:RING-type domain-containing protein n=1 Tax=Candidozyma haemuli TaxID=45357 RepID=A0A2V1ASS3_9ASCO|nr:hypothetical protein CXQ85_001768 [[Candida] haemuloni]KAF3986651.1 hypothetical protein FT662_04432 [[Candida] haemuloni var. vulneris]KAF3990769.1 hypothetical protein FT663_03035 [[Candida] haemuloni var. vulneris]PVH19991.1 hypothetical protein CXQ85_001768 [[Candida] haemuloni]
MVGTDIYRIQIDFTARDESTTEEDQHFVHSPTFDYRYSPISVVSIDPPTMQADAVPNEPLRAKQLGKGVIKLYRDFDDDDQELSSKSLVSSTSDQTMLSIIALPTYFTATDLLGYIGDHHMEHITHIRILRSEKANRFLVLLKFDDVLRAAEFQYHFDGKPFNSMEPEACNVVYVKSVVTTGSYEVPAKDTLIPFLLEDPFTSQPDDTITPIELPTCPVCLERLDFEVSGLLTIPCQHTFHSNCLSKWRDDTCPICRYTNSVSNQNIKRSVRRLSQINSRMQMQQHDPGEEGTSSTSSADVCMDCSVTTNLWVCLICGNVGCDRYAPDQHSLKHFVETGHCFAMELHTSRIWDYAGDRYVHRLVTTEEDGKIVELPEKDNTHPKSNKDDDNEEYSELLLSQLISQKEYYELLLHEKSQNGNQRGSPVATDQGSSKVKELESKVDELSEQLKKLSANVIPALNSKIDLKTKSLRIAASELNEANILNEGLSAKVDHLSQENAKLKESNTDLSDQVKDLMFYLEAQAKFKDQPEDVTEGQVIMKPKRNNKKKK